MTISKQTPPPHQQATYRAADQMILNKILALVTHGTVAQRNLVLFCVGETRRHPQAPAGQEVDPLLLVRHCRVDLCPELVRVAAARLQSHRVGRIGRDA